MEILNDIWNHLTKAANETSAFVNDAVDIAKIRIQICDRKTQIKLAYRTLGEYMYQDYATGSDNNEQCRAILADIDRWHTEIEALERIYKHANPQTHKNEQAETQTTSDFQPQNEMHGKEQSQS